MLSDFGYVSETGALETDRATTSLFYHRFVESLKFGFAERMSLGDEIYVNVTEVTQLYLISIMDKNFKDTIDIRYYKTFLNPFLGISYKEYRSAYK